MKKAAAPEKTWPADRVERRKVTDLVPYARNARTHSPEQISQLAASIKEWGFTVPVLADETGQLIAGHGRVLAAQQLGLLDIPVMTADGWSEAQKKAYALADNKLALNAGWDREMLAIELGDLTDLGADLGLTGFSAPEISELVAGAPDLMDPTDGKVETRGAGAATLVWGKNKVALSEEEVGILDRAMSKHSEVFGVQFGFVRETLARVDLRP